MRALSTMSNNYSNIAYKPLSTSPHSSIEDDTRYIGTNIGIFSYIRNTINLKFKQARERIRHILDEERRNSMLLFMNSDIADNYNKVIIHLYCMIDRAHHPMKSRWLQPSTSGIGRTSGPLWKSHWPSLKTHINVPDMNFLEFHTRGDTRFSRNFYYNHWKKTKNNERGLKLLFKCIMSIERDEYIRSKKDLSDYLVEHESPYKEITNGHLLGYNVNNVSRLTLYSDKQISSIYLREYWYPEDEGK